MHVASFAVYMKILGACGILDHSGIDVRVLGVRKREGGKEGGKEVGLERASLFRALHSHTHI
jgi:hypothetical protein